MSLETRGNVAKVSFLDVGQGDSILIESPSGRKVLIDGGPGSAVLKDLGSTMPFYNKNIDVLIATHPDADHIGGLPLVIRRYNVDYFVDNGNQSDTNIYSDLKRVISDENLKHIVIQKPLAIDLGGGDVLQIIFPDIDTSKMDTNDSSIVAKYIYGKDSVMLTGDSPKKMENYLLSKYGKNLSSEILKLGHHGSKTASGLQYLATVNPSYAIISAGLNNRYGHPNKETLDSLDSLAIPYLNTANVGTIQFDLDGEKAVREE